MVLFKLAIANIPFVWFGSLQTVMVAVWTGTGPKPRQVVLIFERRLREAWWKRFRVRDHVNVLSVFALRRLQRWTGHLLQRRKHGVTHCVSCVLQCRIVACKGEERDSLRRKWSPADEIVTACH